jgi:RHS repeat-associated protein
LIFFVLFGSSQKGQIMIVANATTSDYQWHHELTETYCAPPNLGVLCTSNYSRQGRYRYGYQGQFAERDEETGWNHFELREYDAVVGRWMSGDPMSQFHSKYVGIGNDPCNGVDPTGGCVDSNGRSIPCPVGMSEVDNVNTVIMDEMVVSDSYTGPTGGRNIEKPNWYTMNLVYTSRVDTKIIKELPGTRREVYSNWEASIPTKLALNGVTGYITGLAKGPTAGVVGGIAGATSQNYYYRVRTTVAKVYEWYGVMSVNMITSVVREVQTGMGNVHEGIVGTVYLEEKITQVLPNGDEVDVITTSTVLREWGFSNFVP